MAAQTAWGHVAMSPTLRTGPWLASADAWNLITGTAGATSPSTSGRWPAPSGSTAGTATRS